MCGFITIQTGIFYGFKWSQNQEQIQAYHEQIKFLRSEILPKTDSNYRVIMIGTSLTGQGVECREDYHDGKKIQLLKFWSPGDRFDFFVQSVDLIQDIKTLQPDLICFQSEIAAIKLLPPNSQERETLLDKIVFLSTVNYKFFGQVFKPEKKLAANDFCNPDILRDAQYEDTVRIVPRGRIIKSTENLTSVYHAIKQFKASGIKTVIVDIPRPHAIEQLVYDSTFNTELSKIKQHYLEEKACAWWPYTGQACYFNLFQDMGHLNAMGKVWYSNWLMTQIKASV